MVWDWRSFRYNLRFQHCFGTGTHLFSCIFAEADVPTQQTVLETLDQLSAQMAT